MSYKKLFSKDKAVIGCIHLLALPGSPQYAGSMKNVINQALAEAEIFNQYESGWFDH